MGKNNPKGYQPPKHVERTFDLCSPVTAYGDELEELPARKLRFGDLLDTEGLPALAMAAKLVQLLCNVPMSTVRMMDPTDIAAFSAWVGDQSEAFDAVADEDEEDDDRP